MHGDPGAVPGDDAAGLLAPVLEGIEAEKGDAGRVRVPVDAEDAAVFFGAIILEDDRPRVLGSGFWVLGFLHSSSPHAEAELAVIIPGFCLRLYVERYQKSVKNFEQIVIYLILLQFYPQRTAVVTGQSAGEPGLSRCCGGSGPLTCAGVPPAGADLGGRAAP